MEVVNCPRCGRVFTRISKPVCPACIKEDEETFEKVRSFVKDNPSCSMQEITDATEVSAKRITQYIRDGRLEVSKNMEGGVTCAVCGKPIRIGRFCEKCATGIKIEALEKKREEEIKRTGAMHVGK